MVVKEKGSITVEAALIIPLIILIIVFLYYFALLLYQQVLVQSTANFASGRGAATWNKSCDFIYSGRYSKNDIEEKPLYANLYDYSKEEKIHEIEELAFSRIKNRSVFTNYECEVSVQVKNYLLYKLISVNIECKYNIPIPQLSKLGVTDTITLSGAGDTIIREPAQLIRDTDLLVEAAHEVTDRCPWVRDVIQKIKQVFN